MNSQYTVIDSDSNTLDELLHSDCHITKTHAIHCEGHLYHGGYFLYKRGGGGALYWISISEFQNYNAQLETNK